MGNFVFSCAQKADRGSMSLLALGPVPTVKGFAGDDADGTARVITAAGFCRSTTRFTWMERPLPQVGARASKGHFWIRAKPAKGGEDAEMVLAVARKGARASPQLGADELQTLVCDSLAGHARIFPTEACSLDRGLAIFVREWSDGGSLRDRVYGVRGARTREPCGAKYANKAGKPVEPARARAWGRQVLEALDWLRGRGLVLDHLHSGNVLLDGRDNARVSELEGCLLAFERLRPAAALLAPLEAKGVAVDVALFGHVLFEITRGEELRASTPREHTAAAPSKKPRPRSKAAADDGALEAALELIFEGNEPDTTPDALLALPCFADAASSPPAAGEGKRKQMAKDQRALVRAVGAVSEARRAERIAAHAASTRSPTKALATPAPADRPETTAATARQRHASHATRGRRALRSVGSRASAKDIETLPVEAELAPAAAPTPAPPAEPAGVAPEATRRFSAMLKAGVPAPAIEQKMRVEGLDQAAIASVLGDAASSPPAPAAATAPASVPSLPRPAPLGGGDPGRGDLLAAIGSFKKGDSLRKTADVAKPKERTPPPSAGPLDLLGEMRARQAKRAATAGGE